MLVKLKGPMGDVKEVKLGFSWTTFFFAFFVPLFRGDFLWAAVFFFSPAAVLAIIPMVYPFLSIIFGFIYNKIYVKDLLKKGYEAQTEVDKIAVGQYVN